MNSQPPQGPPGFERDREHHLEDHVRQRAQLQQQQEENMARERAQREREYNDRQERERQERELYGSAGPLQNNAGSIPIHQPVANRPAAIHSPGGLLANHGAPTSSGPLGAPSGPGNAFGGPLHTEASRAGQHNSQSAATPMHSIFGPSILNHNPAPTNAAVIPGGSVPPLPQERLQQLPFGPALTPAHPAAGSGAPALGQVGQQPILNVSKILYSTSISRSHNPNCQSQPEIWGFWASVFYTAVAVSTGSVQ